MKILVGILVVVFVLGVVAVTQRYCPGVPGDFWSGFCLTLGQQ